MKRSMAVIFGSLFLVVLLSVSLASAFWPFTTTGKVVDTNGDGFTCMDGLVSYYDPSSLAVEDLFDGNDGTIRNTVSYLENSSAYDFVDQRGYIDIGRDSNLDVIDGFTFSARIKTDDRAGYIYSKRSDSRGAVSLFLNGEDGAQELWVGTKKASATSDTLINDGQWHYIAATFNNSENEVKYYIDGIPDGDAKNSGRISNSVRAQFGGRVGDSSKSTRYGGLMDEMFIFDKVLSDFQISLLHAGQEICEPAQTCTVYADCGSPNLVGNAACEVDGNLYQGRITQTCVQGLCKKAHDEVITPCANGCEDGASGGVCLPDLATDKISVSGACTDAVIYGDVNSNGKIRNSDFLIVRAALIDSVALTDCQAKAADVNCDGYIDDADVTAIQVKVSSRSGGTPLLEDSYCNGVVPTCTDSDGGSDYTSRGEISWDGNPITEYILENNQELMIFSPTSVAVYLDGMFAPKSLMNQDLDREHNFSFGGTGRITDVAFSSRDGGAKSKITVEYSTPRDGCDAGAIREWSCDSSGVPVVENHDCAYGCYEGLCLPDPDSLVCTDSDGGQNAYVFGYTTKYINFGPSNDYCASGVNYDSDGSGNHYGVVGCTGGDCYVMEMACNDDDTGSMNLIPCPNGCDDGACLPDPAGPNCTDNDGGINYTIKGSVMTPDNNGVWSIVGEDLCIDSVYVNEYYCDGSEAKSLVNSCSSGTICYGGACIDENADVPQQNSQDPNDPANMGPPVNSPTPEETTCINNNGCYGSDSVCYSIHEVFDGEYCSDTGFVPQEDHGGSCNQGYECLSEVCYNNECVGSQGFIEWLLNFLGIGN